MPSWNPTDYAANSPKQQRWGEELLAKIKLGGDERILDIGCGDGRLTAKIAALVPQGSVLGMDASPDMIAHARENHPADLYPHLSFAQGDARDVGLLDEFDLIFSNAALHWVRNHRPMIQNLAKALRPGGRTLWQMGGKGNAADMVAVLEGVMASDEWREYYQGFTFPYGFHGASQYEGWLKESGLTPLRVELIAKDMIHEGRDGLASWLRTTWLPYLDPLPPETHDQFIAQACDAFMTAYPPPNGHDPIVKMVRLEVEAMKPA